MLTNQIISSDDPETELKNVLLKEKKKRSATATQAKNELNDLFTIKTSKEWVRAIEKDQQGYKDFHATNLALKAVSELQLENKPSASKFKEKNIDVSTVKTVLTGKLAESLYLTGGTNSPGKVLTRIIQELEEQFSGVQEVFNGLKKRFPELYGKDSNFQKIIKLDYSESYEKTKASTPQGLAYSQAVEDYHKIGDKKDSRKFSPAAQELITNEAKQRAEIIKLKGQEAEKTAELDNSKQKDQQLTENVGKAVKTTNDRVSEAIENQRRNSDQYAKSVKSQEAFENSLNRITYSVKRFFSVGTAAVAFRRLVSQTFRDVQQLDKSFASIALVTNQSVSGLWSTYGQYADMATQLGQSTDSIIKASALFYQQGLDTNEALALTTDTMKLATLAGNDYETATQEMTAALRGFKMEMDEGAHITDVYSELAAHAAASVDDIAKAMSRTASIGA